MFDSRRSVASSAEGAAFNSHGRKAVGKSRDEIKAHRADISSKL